MATNNAINLKASGIVSYDGAGTFSGLTDPLPATHGGTAQSTYASGDILYASATNTLSKLAKGTDTQVLTLSGGLPTWAAAGGGGGAGTTGFLVYPSADLTGVTGDGTVYTIHYDTKLYDPGTNFSSQTTYTAPSTGFYVFYVQLTQNADTDTNRLIVNLVTTSFTYRLVFGQWAIQGQVEGINYYETYTACQTASLTAGNTVQVQYSANGDGAAQNSVFGGNAPILTSFSGYKVA